jgi:hypothetical protein
LFLDIKIYNVVQKMTGLQKRIWDHISGWASEEEILCQVQRLECAEKLVFRNRHFSKSTLNKLCFVKWIYMINYFYNIIHYRKWVDTPTCKNWHKISEGWSIIHLCTCGITLHQRFWIFFLQRDVQRPSQDAKILSIWSQKCHQY